MKRNATPKTPYGIIVKETTPPYKPICQFGISFQRLDDAIETLHFLTDYLFEDAAYGTANVAEVTRPKNFTLTDSPRILLVADLII